MILETGTFDFINAYSYNYNTKFVHNSPLKTPFFFFFFAKLNKNFPL